MTVRRSAFIFLFAVLLSACGGESPPRELPFADPDRTPAATTETVPVETVPEDVVDPIVTENEDLIAFQARWVCELQRRTFPDLTDMDSALDEALAETDLSRAAYDEFVEKMSQSQPLRDAVLKLYGERCRA